MAASGKLRIGDWQVDPAAGLIMRADVCERLEARTLRLLVDLAEHAGETVSIDDLLDRVWAGVIVTPDSVYQAVAVLRRMLDDDPKRPRYIATVPRLGYRMVAKVEPWTDTASRRPSRRLFGRRAAWAFGVVVAGLLFSVILVFSAYERGALRLPGAATPSVAALVFLDMTASMNNEVMVDDFSERLAARLGQNPHLRTPGFRAALALEGKRLGPMQAARVLGVAYVIEGSVHSNGSGYRVTANLIRADKGFVVWSHGYDETAQSMLTAHDTIAVDLAKVLTAKGHYRLPSMPSAG